MQYKEQIHNYVQSHKEEIVETLKELIKIPSVRGEAEENAPFGKACADVLKYTQELYNKNGFVTELDAAHHSQMKEILEVYAYKDLDNARHWAEEVKKLQKMPV